MKKENYLFPNFEAYWKYAFHEMQVGQATANYSKEDRLPPLTERSILSMPILILKEHLRTAFEDSRKMGVFHAEANETKNKDANQAAINRHSNKSDRKKEQ